METVTWCFLVIKFKLLLSEFFRYLWRVFKQQTCMDIRNSWMSCMIFFVVCWWHSGFLHPPVLSPEVANIKVIYIVFLFHVILLYCFCLSGLTKICFQFLYFPQPLEKLPCRDFLISMRLSHMVGFRRCHGISAVADELHQRGL